MRRIAGAALAAIALLLSAHALADSFVRRSGISPPYADPPVCYQLAGKAGQCPANTPPGCWQFEPVSKNLGQVQCPVLVPLGTAADPPGQLDQRFPHDCTTHPEDCATVPCPPGGQGAVMTPTGQTLHQPANPNCTPDTPVRHNPGTPPLKLPPGYCTSHPGDCTTPPGKPNSFCYDHPEACYDRRLPSPQTGPSGQGGPGQ